MTGDHSIRPRIGANGSASVALWAALGALILGLPAVLNGMPFLYIDSATYLAQGQAAISAAFPSFSPASEPLPGGQIAPPALVDGDGDGDGSASGDASVIVSGRSIYFGILAYLAVLLTGGWGLVGLQAFATALPLTLAVRAAAPTIWRAGTIALIALVTFASPAGLFVGLMMPDIWLAASLLSIGVVFAVPTLERRWQLTLFALIAFAGMAHTSHLLVIVGFAVLAGLLSSGVTRRRLPGAALWTPAPLIGLSVCVMAGVLSSILFAEVVERRFGAKPIARPHLTARLLEDPASMGAVEAVCSDEPRYAVCRYTGEFPIDWNTFLFADEAGGGVFETADPRTRRQLSREDRSVFLAALSREPIGLGALLIGDAGRQFVHFPARGLPLLASRSPASLPAFSEDLQARSARARLSNHAGVLDRLDAVHRVSFWGALLVASYALTRGVATNTPMRREGLMLLGVLVIGLLANAAVCGILASPYGRFQARIAWLALIAGPLALTAMRPVPFPSLRRKDVLS